ncbi:phosphodiester glycosidase family protein [Kribbella qitaiheensis]|uniref:Phosphodiester glycosidase family protein n=1 Tax=Kribbella qitaiheensis TaxID=1544730 RepID=A0A7G6X8W5_9ACTN|nr:phosphodiester glycosidase family protein [Kribbella qitaiheensis]QNE22680.1 phosphodiester glycosidase family protein [Kribbella qitaiheensis]
MKETLPVPAKKVRRRRRRRWVTLVVCLLLVVPVISYVRALLYPGNASFAVRSVEWVRDHGGGNVIDAIETWRYSRHAPPTSGAPQDVSIPAGPAPVAAKATGLPVIKLLPGVKALPHEGVWTSARRDAKGKTLLWTSWVRPDPAHLPVTASAALIPQTSSRLRLMPGTREPVPGMRSKDGYSVPSDAKSGLIATFNGGFKLADSHGGWWTTDSAPVPLVDGRASVVVNSNGTARIGEWNKTVKMSPDVVAVRQNLDLVIVDGKIVDGLTSNAQGRWGSVRSQFQYTWRSGLGTDARGDLIYVAGQGLTLATLAVAMQQSGIQQGMELDIHAAMVSLDIEQPSGNGAVTSRRLISSMASPADRYLVDDQRDFFYVVTR